MKTKRVCAKPPLLIECLLRCSYWVGDNLLPQRKSTGTIVRTEKSVGFVADEPSSRSEAFDPSTRSESGPLDASENGVVDGSENGVDHEA